MKTIKILALGLVAGIGFSACSSVLEEQPRTSYDPTFFGTKIGIEGGLTALYSHLRDLYGNGYYYNSLETGTDEFTWAQSADGNFKDADLSGAGSPLSSTNCRSDALWNNAFPYINTASGVIENGTEAKMDPALIAEAKFFRAFDYFQLVQTFGGVPLDLGAGEMKFNTSSVRVSKRNTVPEVYNAIFSDLRDCVNDLPENPRVTGGVTKALAKVVLAKAYLTFAWWLQNPNDIPTYPAAERKSLEEDKGFKEYFQMAYDMALDVIAHPGPFKLQDTYFQVNLAENDRNSEIMLYADHTEFSQQYNGADLGWGNGGGSENFVSWMACWNYTTIVIKGNDGSGFNPVQRDCVPALGRPWTRMAPIQEVFLNTFKDKTYDSRYDGTFTYKFHANWQKSGSGPASAVGANGMTINKGKNGAFGASYKDNYGLGDVVLTFLDENVEGGLKYPATKKEDGSYEIDLDVAGNNIGAASLPGRADFVIEPKGISRISYPVLYKLGPYRTDNGTGFGPGVNAGSTRPFPIVKFSEAYFIAAEAAVKGAQGTKTARELINEIRGRAGKWMWDNNNGFEKKADFSEQMKAATPAEITIDYILDERSREYFGEGQRWFELARTQTWHTRAAKYTICGDKTGDYVAVTYDREIGKSGNKYLYLRPIPQGQLDGMEMTDEELASYQNPGYK